MTSPCCCTAALWALPLLLFGFGGSPDRAVQCGVWQDPGALAVDILPDGAQQDLTDTIMVVYSALVTGTFGVLNTAQVGQQVVEYSVVDDAGNVGSATRVVTIVPQDELPTENIPSSCTVPQCEDPTFVFDCNGVCAPAAWIGDSWCEDGSPNSSIVSGQSVNFNCEFHAFDSGDC